MASVDLTFLPLIGAIICLIYFSGCDSIRLGPPNLKGIGMSTRQSTVISSKGGLLDNSISSDSLRWIAPLQDASYLRPSKKSGLLSLKLKDNRLSFLGGNDQDCTLIEGLDTSAKVELDSLGGAFISFKFPNSLSQHDAIMGKISPSAKLLAHSRIKR